MDSIVGLLILAVLSLIALMMFWKFFPGFVMHIVRLCIAFIICYVVFGIFTWEVGFTWQFLGALVVVSILLRIPSELQEIRATELALAKENAERSAVGLDPISKPTKKS